MTDDLMHERLLGAGARWRAAQNVADEAPPAEPLAADLQPAPTRHPRRGLVTSAIAVAAAVVVGGSLLVGGLGHDRGPTTSARPLQGTVWRLTSYGDSDPTAGNPTTFVIGTDGAVVVDDACTVVGARADVDTKNHQLDLVDVSERSKACVDETGSTLDKQGLDALLRPLRWTVGGNTLTLRPATGGARITMRATTLPAPTFDLPTLTGTTWRLTSVTGATGQRIPTPGTAGLEIDNGRLTAGDTCNTLTAAAAADGVQLDLKSVSSTRRPCPFSRVLPVVDAVLGAGRVEARVEGTTLTLSRPGTGTLTYAWQPQDPAAVDPAQLVNRTWTLQSISGEPASAPVQLSVGADTYTLQVGCRLSDGAVTVGRGTITLDPAGGKVPPQCPGSKVLGDLQRRVRGLLGPGAGWAVRDGRLIIYGGGSQANALVFTPHTAVTPTLAGTAWRLVGIGGAGAAVAAPARPGLRLQFGTQPPVGFDDGFNFVSGAVTIGPHTLAFGELASTAVGCSGTPACTQAGLIGLILNGTVSWSVTADRLTVRKPGVGTLVYDRARPTPEAPASATATR